MCFCNGTIRDGRGPGARSIGRAAEREEGRTEMRGGEGRPDDRACKQPGGRNGRADGRPGRQAAGRADGRAAGQASGRTNGRQDGAANERANGRAGAGAGTWPARLDGCVASTARRVRAVRPTRAWPARLRHAGKGAAARGQHGAPSGRARRREREREKRKYAGGLLQRVEFIGGALARGA